jgi:hypothetical protein
MPIINPMGPNVTLTDNITITKDPADTTHPNAVIRYTTDGNDPTSSSPQYNGPFVLNVSMGSNPIVKAVAFDGTMSSGVAVKYYTVASATGSVTNISATNGNISLSVSPLPTVAPAFADFIVEQSIDGGAYTTITPMNVMGTAAMPNVTITVAQITPGAVLISGKYRVKYKNGAYSSDATFQVQPTGGGTLAIPTFARTGNTVTISSTTPNVTIKYTTDGTEPMGNPTAPMAMAPVNVTITSANMVIKAFAINENVMPIVTSNVAISETYSPQAPKLTGSK